MPRGIYGPDRREVTGGWKKDHNEGICNLDCAADYLSIKVR
jgi:hypothetical protein